MTPRRFLLTSVFLWCAVIAATPLLASYDGAATKAAFLSYQFFSRVCHQLDSHSFHLAGFKFAVCIRCSSIYASFFLGLLFFPIIKRTKIVDVHPARVLGLSLLPMGIDVALDTLGIHESTTTTRGITGLIFGLALTIVLVPVLEELAEKFLSHMHTFANTLELRNLQSAQNLRNQRSEPNLHNLQAEQNLRNQQSEPNLRNLSNQPRTSYATKTR
jgi:uncharacterized membrane protein